jgi:hypothetical protein
MKRKNDTIYISSFIILILLSLLIFIGALSEFINPSGDAGYAILIGPLLSIILAVCGYSILKPTKIRFYFSSIIIVFLSIVMIVFFFFNLFQILSAPSGTTDAGIGIIPSIIAIGLLTPVIISLKYRYEEIFSLSDESITSEIVKEQ